jgi:hypothetical protein
MRTGALAAAGKIPVEDRFPAYAGEQHYRCKGEISPFQDHFRPKSSLFRYIELHRL